MQKMYRIRTRWEMIRPVWNNLKKEIHYEVSVGEKYIIYNTREEAEKQLLIKMKKYKAGDSPLCKMMLTLLN